ncbi:iron-containing alcohol dehydrogenase [Bacillus sp. FJAT-42376]|uniref:iron-containing alcohol dehydrogenase n=1 Tax=Bacillus sp. FJAT-42376 TaxID=2014076 RepID=UPI000F4E661D|nr:iron-containing alcohol dehydrogenase [Bacillus sp. FJAT-42376]AZB41184.1 iron-containing alcohol dehydrogenase [Bacillus sp. FJAT-42376]
MNTFLQHNPTKLWFGKGQISQLGSELGGRGKNVLIVYGGGSIKKNGVYDAVMEELDKSGANVFELSGVEPNPRLSTVKAGIALCREKEIDLMLAIGGGSVIDCVKAISIGVFYEGDVWDVICRKGSPERALPFGTVLTLAATGSEMNNISVITDWEKNEKRGWGSPLVFPQFSILDPSYTFSVPRDQTVYGVVDIMSHALEQYFHRTDNTPMIDRFIESLLLTVMEAGAELVNDLRSFKLRETVMYAGTTAFNETLSNGTDGGDWGSHQIEHAVSAIYDIPHGGGLAIIFPNWMSYCSEIDPSRMKKLAVNVFKISPEGKSDLETAKEGIAALRSYWNSIGAPSRLSDYGIDDSRLEELVEKSFMKDQVGTYKILNKEDVREILLRSM